MEEEERAEGEASSMSAGMIACISHVISQKLIVEENLKTVKNKMMNLLTQDQ